MLAALALLGAAVPGAPEPSPETLRRRIEAVTSRRAFTSALWGIEVRGLRTGRVLYARAADKNLRPGSAMKLVTTAAALDALGPEARLRTTVESAARLDDTGDLEGDLFLVGRGDPSLSGRFALGRITAGLEDLADQLWAAGLRRVEGRLIGHEGAFEGERRGSDWTWEDLVWSYGAEASALSFNDNAARLRLRPGARAGDPAVLEQEPASDQFRVTSTATTAPAGSKSEPVLDQPLPNLFRLSGTVAIGDRPWEGEVAIADPARYATAMFAAVLKARGIQVAGELATTSDPLPGGSRALAFRDSPPVGELLKVVNKESQNLHAEILLRLLGQKVKGLGTAEAGTEAAREFLARSGVAAEAFSLEDGSGLSRSDLLSAHGLAGLLVAMDRHPFGRVYRDSLAEPGQKGTLEHRLARMAGRLQAKTGTLRFVNALAGYLSAADGDRLAFAIIVNNHTMPGREALAAIDEIAMVIGGS